MTLSTNDTRRATLCIECHYAERHYAECRISLIVMLNVVMLSVVMLNVVMLSVVMLNVVMLSVVMLNVVMLNLVADGKPPPISSKPGVQLIFVHKPAKKSIGTIGNLDI
jgi:hypothetical protein